MTGFALVVLFFIAVWQIEPIGVWWAALPFPVQIIAGICVGIVCASAGRALERTDD